MTKRLWLAFGFCLTLPAACQNAPVSKSSPAAQNDILSITTDSDLARKTYLEGMTLSENIRRREALERFRSALKHDPDFGLAWAQVDLLTNDPKEEAAARQKAKLLAAKASPGEQLLIKWIVGGNESDSVRAIAAMNDLHAMYPKDRQLGFLFGQWLIQQQSYDRAIQILEQAIQSSPDYAAAYNELGYAYSYSGDHEKSLAMMKKYVELLPNEPNPHDSFAELNRLAGRFEEALAHYQQALKIMPAFTSSQLGIADTYALMGEQDRARAEYDKAIAQETGERERMDYRFQRAMTYIREKDLAGARKEFSALADSADKAGFADLESECHRAMASIEPDRPSALKHIELAESVLKHPHQASKTVLEQQMGRVLRSKAIIAEYSGSKQVAASALKQLERMAQGSRDQLIQSSYHGARGGILFARKNYAQAANELAEDANNALSQSRLAEAYSKLGKEIEAKSERDRLHNQHRVLLEDALVRL